VEGPDCSSGKLNPISDFLQWIVIRAVPLRPPQSKSNSFQDREDEIVDEIIERKGAVVWPEKAPRDRRGCSADSSKPYFSDNHNSCSAAIRNDPAIDATRATSPTGEWRRTPKQQFQHCTIRRKGTWPRGSV
jgi:hypothetical protein